MSEKFEKSIREWYEKSENPSLEFLKLANKPNPTTSDLANNLEIVYNKISLLSTMEMDLTRGTQMVYVIPDIMMNIEDFANHIEISIQTRGYQDWQGGSSNLLVTRMMIGRLTNTSFTNFSYNVQNVADYLASRGVVALPGTRFTTDELQRQRWIIRPMQRRNPMAPTRVDTRMLLDGSVSLQFQGYTPIAEPRAITATNQDDVEDCLEGEILSVLITEEPVLEVMRLHAEAIAPVRRTSGAAGYDLHICNNYLIKPWGRSLLHTGLAFAIPEGYFGHIMARSGSAWKKGIVVGAGAIDSDYRGEVKILVFNMQDKELFIQAGEAIAQISEGSGGIKKKSKGGRGLSP